MKYPVIIYCCKGWEHLCYAIWSIRSLEKFNYQFIEVIVSNQKEKNFLHKKLPDIVCTIQSADSRKYPAFSYKPFVLKEYLDNFYIHLQDRDIVVCDADILWLEDPRELFKRIDGKFWAQKITAINPNDYKKEPSEIGAANIGLRTVINFDRKKQVKIFPNYRVNAGLFRVNKKLFKEVIYEWMEKILFLSDSEMLMSEAILSLLLAEKNITPYCDIEDIKHFGVHNENTDLKVAKFKLLERNVKKQSTGYQTAKHYFSDQRKYLHKDASRLGLDPDKLIFRIWFFLNLRKIKLFPKRISIFLKRVSRN